MFKHWFCWKYQYNKCMFNIIDIYSFISMSGCVGRGPGVLFCPGSYNAVKTALFNEFHKGYAVHNTHSLVWAPMLVRPPGNCPRSHALRRYCHWAGYVLTIACTLAPFLKISFLVLFCPGSYNAVKTALFNEFHKGYTYWLKMGSRYLFIQAKSTIIMFYCYFSVRSLVHFLFLARLA
jgi:hypothetical protein